MAKRIRMSFFELHTNATVLLFVAVGSFVVAVHPLSSLSLLSLSFFPRSLLLLVLLMTHHHHEKIHVLMYTEEKIEFNWPHKEKLST